MSNITNITIVGQLFLEYDYMHKGTCDHVEIRLAHREVAYSINKKKKDNIMNREDANVLFHEIAKAVQSMIDKNKTTSDIGRV